MSDTNVDRLTHFSIHPGILPGFISLSVASLENQVQFYQQALGFELHWREGSQAGLGAEGNGIELYRESPEDGAWSMESGEYITRRADGSMSDGREPLDLDALFSHLREDDRLDERVHPEMRLGHVHLHVRNLKEAVDFYHGIIGFDVMGVAKTFRAAIVSAGGYHHHIGLNTWQGEDTPPAPQDALGLRYFSMLLPNQAALDEVTQRIEQAGIPANQTNDGLLLHNPSQNGILLTAKS